MPSPYMIPFAPKYGASVGRIADLMRRRGDIAAQRALYSGELWGNTLRDIGQMIAQIPETRAREEERRARIEARQADAEYRRQQMERQQRMDEAKEAAAKREALDEAEAGMAFNSVVQEGANLGQPPNLGAMLSMGVSPFLTTKLGQAWKQVQPDPVKPLKAPTPLERANEARVAGDEAGWLEALADERVQREQGRAPTANNRSELEEYLFRKHGQNWTPEQYEAAKKKLADAVREPERPPDYAANDAIADAWRAGMAFPSTQDATSAALESFRRRGLPTPRKLTAVMQKESVANADTIQTIEDVRDAYALVRNKVGPISYQLNEWGVKLPFIAEDPDFVEFNTLLRGMGNLEIKRVTGAQMSEAEATRLLKGMATGTLKPADFEAALRTMERNARRNQQILLYGVAEPRRRHETDIQWTRDAQGRPVQKR